ncbi:hypothetical protein [Winogradskyella sp.]|uniref:hypothetical protein n=1 Tax=Winogradskyella sp. TaxID=1883156 RepID=UPI00262EA447|nr:hypothetical protein [Winogradskyella sp.]
MRYWKSIIALIIMPFALYYNWSSFYFAIVFLIWSIQGIRAKTAIFLDHVPKDESPFLFWLISVVWLVLSLLSFVYSEQVINWYYGY